jgi:hypothetical protein
VSLARCYTPFQFLSAIGNCIARGTVLRIMFDGAKGCRKNFDVPSGSNVLNFLGNALVTGVDFFESLVLHGVPVLVEAGSANLLIPHFYMA